MSMQLMALFTCRRECYFRNESLHVKKEFIRDINGSYRIGNLNLSWADKETTEYIQFKIRESGQLPRKHAVEKPGLQDDGT